MGIAPEKIYVLWMLTSQNAYQPSKDVLELEKRCGVNFFYYEDDRESYHYQANTKPFLMKKHMEKYPRFNLDNVIFWHDTDIIFTKPVDFSFVMNDEKWYLSDTISYVGHDYIVSKGQHVLEGMCKIVGVSEELVKSRQSQSGGAQYIVKNTDASFWDKVEKDSVRLFYYMKATEDIHIKKHELDYAIQSWCGEMWATLWNAWYYQHETVVHPYLNFVFSTYTMEQTMAVNIFHNAGATGKEPGIFYKGEYFVRSPFGQELPVDETKGSYLYVQAIKEANKKRGI